MSDTLLWVRRNDHLRSLYEAALAAADPGAAVTRTLRFEPGTLWIADRPLAVDARTRVWLIALGKASCGMSRAAISVLGNLVAGGIVAYPHGLDPGGDWPVGVKPIAAAHPLPDAGSLRAGEETIGLLSQVRAADVVLVLVSGGGSALLEALRPGITLPDLRRLTESLQHAGADIEELNVVRRALSRIKGGGLARAAAPARVVSLVLSDVLGDRLEVIASGPTIESSSGPGEAWAVLERRGLAAALPGVTEVLRGAVAVPPTEAAGVRLATIVGSNAIAAEALRSRAEALGFRALLLTDRMQGEAREVGRCLGGIARGILERELPFPPPACIVLGGETTVTVNGKGRGGRNLELVLGAALGLAGCPRTAVFGFATDGVDGSSGAAGAVATGETIARAEALGLSAYRALADNDSEWFFRELGDLWITGATGTNVNDLVALLAYPR